VNVALDRLILKSLSFAVTTVPVLPPPAGAADVAALLDMALLGEGLLGVTDAVGLAAEVPPLPPQPLTESAVTATTATPIQRAGDRGAAVQRCVLMSPPVTSVAPSTRIEPAGGSARIDIREVLSGGGW